ncbi:hypothetical protein PIB30_075853 [Stylosanthes scabra]|uniref:beta-galactosidase n=1 Tax=Stylosanthes scabra TaxID=79078 RepID=A0ABU6VTI9_9FABA|nr:hypothetical protein [Stylosanthes scabra]
MKSSLTFKGPNSPNKPSIWIENWTTFYQAFGENAYIRSAEDIAYNVALFFAKKGSYVNYYMYHGGTNFDRLASAYIIIAYYDEAPLDEYGKSMGSRVGCMVTSLEDINVSAIVCLGHPLKGINGAIRDETLLHLTVPTMFIQGSKHALSTREVRS